MYQVLIKDNFRMIVIKEKQSKLLLILLVVQNVNCPAKVEFRKVLTIHKASIVYLN